MDNVVKVEIVDESFGKVEPFTVTWRDLSYVVTPSTLSKMAAKLAGKEVPQTRTILNSVSGQFASGQLTALMGPSGAGKSTLLECLIGIRSEGKRGQVVLSGSKKLSMAFIPQQDHFQNLLTVREALYFASKLQNYGHDIWKDTHQHMKRVTQLIRRLGLDVCADNRITRCSGGQLKRLSIGQELVAEPDILILDEPTSGLDSSSCYSTVEFLHGLTQEEGIAIVATIHQPSAKVFNLFHKVYALSKIGKCIYEGKPPDLIEYVARFQLQVPQFYNPADYMIEVASGDYGLDAVRKMASFKDQTDLANTEELEGNPFEDMVIRPPFPFFRHLELLTKRAMLCMLRDPLVFVVRLGSHFIVAIFIGLLYQGARIGTSDACPSALEDAQDLEKLSDIRERMEDEVVAIQNNIGNWFFAIIFIQFGGLLPTVLSVPMGMSAFAKERTNGWYGVNSYFFANILADIPLQIICPIVYISLMWYFTEQIFELDRFAIVILTYIVLAFLSQSHGVLVGAIFMKSVVTAVFVAPMTCIPLLLFSGFFVKVENISTYLKPLTMISYNRYAFENSMAALYGFNRCGADSIDVIEVTKKRLAFFLGNILSNAFGGDDGDSLEDGGNHTLGRVNVDNMTSSLVKGIIGQLGGDTEIVDGKPVFGVLGVFKLSEEVIIPNILAMVIFFVILRALTYLMIYYKGTNKRG